MSDSFLLNLSPLTTGMIRSHRNPPGDPHGHLRRRRWDAEHRPQPQRVRRIGRVSR
jgi:hypothetical protein